MEKYRKYFIMAAFYAFYIMLVLINYQHDPFLISRLDDQNQITYVNSKYSASPSDDGQAYGSDAGGAEIYQGAGQFECRTEEQLQEIVRECMLARTTDFSVIYLNPAPAPILSTDTFNDFMQNIFSVDDPASSSDFDYLKLSWTSAQLEVENNNNGTVFKFSFSYLTTADEEKYIDQKAHDILASLKLEGLSDYDKVKAVNDYLINAVAYDSSLAHKSAYDAICSGTTICRGYGLLTYKMLDTLSVPVRIITGTADGKPHAWNLVKLGDEWYNLDVTWDDITGSDRFFLKNNKDFILHKSDDLFQSSDFASGYPVAKKSL